MPFLLLRSNVISLKISNSLCTQNVVGTNVDKYEGKAENKMKSALLSEVYRILEITPEVSSLVI